MSVLSRITGLSHLTIVTGQKELEVGDVVNNDSICAVGDSRKKTVGIDPTLISDLQMLVHASTSEIAIVMVLY